MCNLEDRLLAQPFLLCIAVLLAEVHSSFRPVGAVADESIDVFVDGCKSAARVPQQRDGSVLVFNNAKFVN
jgi:hypothetical protein